MYLHGIAGSGKSSFARAFVPALAEALEEHVDPQLQVRFVKFNLNKPLSKLKAELRLCANNNDMSVMSIVQGRRQTLAQAKPGLTC